ncbi:hypothetical protein QM012_002512 [Aureobasidium pullulans]|uniref:Alpha 1,4-glycosyltransferase domain-containing protein n=1 Tax=Aureobasidium pullulans TaxID=5580 RepID=A0ABR0TCJ6_AURPU
MRCLKFLFFIILVICILRKVCSQIAFERKLHTAAITFNDFPPDYAEALIAAQRESKTLIYTWPSRSNDTIPSAAAQTTIPPIVHFIWFQDLYTEHLDISQIPTSGSHALAACQHHNPSFKIRVWNATTARTLLLDHYAWFLPRYDNYKYPIQRIDAFKHFLLWHYGGVYMDLDISCRRPLDPLFGFAAWLPKAAPFGVNNDLMAVRARHPMLGEMLQELAVRDRDWVFPYLTVFGVRDRSLLVTC